MPKKMTFWMIGSSLWVLLITDTHTFAPAIPITIAVTTTITIASTVTITISITTHITMSMTLLALLWVFVRLS